MAFDLNLLSLTRRNGQDIPEPGGLHIAAPPRRMARGRQPDRVILYFCQEGNAPRTAEQQSQLMKRLAQTYYSTPGSVTAAMRNVAESLNQYLLDRNQRAANAGRQEVGLLGIITVREERLYLAQCGPLQAFVISASGVQHDYDPQTARRGLGLGRSTPIYYAQAELAAGDTVIISPQPLPAWTPGTLSGLHGQGPEGLWQRLSSQAGPELEALLLQAHPGAGKTFLLKPKPGGIQTAITTPADREVAPAPLPAALPVPAVEMEAPLPEVQLQPEADLALAVPAIEIPTPSYAPEEQAVPPRRQERPPETASAPPPAARPAPKAAPRRTGQGRRALGTILRAFGVTVGQAMHSMRTFLGRMLPGEGIFTLPSSVMAFSAVAVPLIVVTIASVVYIQRGRGGQYQVYYTQAVQAAGVAETQSSPAAQREAWQTVLDMLDQAETYAVTEDSQALRSRAVLAFDVLNMVRRLDFQPAISGGIPSSTRIVQLATTASDLYVLDSATGSVYRAVNSSRGYLIDATFQCGPGYPGSQSVGPLVDILALSTPSSSGATLLGLDASGNLLLCRPNEPPLFTPLATPFTDWDEPKAFTADLENIYVMDPGKDAVWIYRIDQFTSPPTAFFTGDPPDLQNTVDLAVQKDDLYLLGADGQMTLCTFSNLSVSTTQCNLLPYTDARPGQEGLLVSAQTPFSHLAATQPPDPSLYLLEPNSQALYHFSLRLTFQQQLRPFAVLGGSGSQISPATAFALTLDKRVAFLALSNEVYYAGVP